MAEDRDQYDNPVAGVARNGATSPAAAAFETEEGADGAGGESPSKKVAEHVTELNNDELSDLTFAFQACDVDGEGTIDVDELHSMLALLGTELSMEETAALMKKAKQDFKDWLATHEVGTELPEYFDQKESKSDGVHGESKHGGDRHFHEIDIDKSNRHHPILSRVQKAHQNPLVKVVAAPVTYTGKLLDISYQMAKKALPSKTTTEIDETELMGGNALLMEENALHGVMDSDSDMIFAEYVHMMCGEVIKEYVPADWRQSAYQMRLYRNAYDTADVDGDNKLEFRELEMVVMALDPHHSLTHEDMEYLWGVLNPDGHKELTFNLFLKGMKSVKKDSKCSTWIDINKPNKWEILSLIIDTPVGEAEEKRILSNLTGAERAGIKILAAHTQPMDRERMGQVLKRAGDGRLRHLQQSQLDRMKQVHHRCVILCGLIGYLFTMGPATFENWLVWSLEVDGAKEAYWVCKPHSVPDVNGTSYVSAWAHDATIVQHPELFRCKVNIWNESDCIYPSDYVGNRAGDVDWEVAVPDEEKCTYCSCVVCNCVPTDDEGELDHYVLTVFWVLNLAFIVFNIVFEIALLMYLAVRYCVQVAWALDYRLVPLNADRAFVADSLVRAAFELGNPDSPVLGVDPHRETTSSNRMRIALMLILYKAKVVGTGLVLKAILGVTAPARFSIFAKPWIGTVGGTVFWDSLIAHCIVHQAEIRGIGVYTSVELFNEVLDLHFDSAADISPLGKIQIARAVGVAIVKNGSMYPTMELLLRHAIQYLGLRGKSVIALPGTLDSEDGFIMDLQGIDPEDPDTPGLTKEEQVVVLSIHLLALMLDGAMSKNEKELWRAVVDSVDPGVAGFYDDRITYLCTRFREFEPISAEILHQCFDPDAAVEVPEIAKCQNFMFQFAEMLTC